LVHRPSCRASLAPTLISIVTAFLFRGTRFFLVIAQKVVLSRGGLFLQGDVVTESLEFSDEMAPGLFGVGSAQVFGAEVVVGNIFLRMCHAAMRMERATAMMAFLVPFPRA
jgi:hypothetical protein